MQTQQPTRRSCPRHPRGAAAVEFALVLPLFLALVLGIVEFGRAMMVGQLVTNAAREGARLAVVNGSTNAAVEAAVIDKLERTLGIAGSSEGVSVECSVEPDLGHPDAGDEVSNADTRDLCTIEVRVSHELVKYLGLTYLANTDFVARTGRSGIRYLTSVLAI